MPACPHDGREIRLAINRAPLRDRLLRRPAAGRATTQNGFDNPDHQANRDQYATNLNWRGVAGLHVPCDHRAAKEDEEPAEPIDDRRVKVHTKIPLAVYAPATDADFDFMLSPGHSDVVGTHDGIPVHEYCTAAQYPNSDYTYGLRYYSKTHRLPCLDGSIIPGCTTRDNRNL
jgi:hypothetical protein